MQDIKQFRMIILRVNLLFIYILINIIARFFVFRNFKLIAIFSDRVNFFYVVFYDELIFYNHLLFP